MFAIKRRQRNVCVGIRGKKHLVAGVTAASCGFHVSSGDGLCGAEFDCHSRNDEMFPVVAVPADTWQ